MLMRMVVIVLSLLLSACAPSSPEERLRAVPHIISDNLDITAMGVVFAKGFGDIKDRAFEDPNLSKLFMAGLGGLKTIDPNVEMKLEDQRLFISYAGHYVTNLRAPQDGLERWSTLAVKSLLTARKKSPLLRASNAEQIYKAVFTGALATIDNYSRYATREDAIRNRLLRDGVIGLGIAVDMVKKGAAVHSVVKGGAGARGGVMIDDIILTADGVPLARLPIAQVRERLDGAQDTPIMLTVKRRGQSKPVMLTVLRDLVVPDTVTSSIVDNVVTLRIRNFNQRTVGAVERAVDTARRETYGKLRGVILDMRGDPGGLLDQSIGLADLFLDSGTIAVLHGRHPGAQQFYAAHPGDIAAGLPIAVIVDGRSASATEIMTAALQDNHRAIVIGTVTWGKGSVQNLRRLPNHGELSLTWARSVTPRGVALHGLGILPDICLAGDLQSVDQVIGTMFQKPHPTLETRGLWRAAPDDPVAHRTLRATCTPETHPDRALDLDVARRIISDPVLMALASPANASQFAIRP